MNVGQSGLVPTERKLLANPRGGGFTGANGARGRRGRARRDSKARTGGPRPQASAAREPSSPRRAPELVLLRQIPVQSPGSQERAARAELGDRRGGGATRLPRSPQAVTRHVFIRCQRRGSALHQQPPRPPPTRSTPPTPRSPSWDDLGKGDCGGFGLKDWRLSEGKLPWVASRLAAPSSGDWRSLF